MKQVAWNLTAAPAGLLTTMRYVLMDRDGKFSAAFRRILAEAGKAPVSLPPRSPTITTHLEKFWLSLRAECPDGLVFFGQGMRRRAVLELVAYYHR
jgi:hypothetical protein